MDRSRLEQYLADGLSLEKIGVLENRDPSTVSYWVRKHGLKPAFEAHGRRGSFDAAELAETGLTLEQIAERLDVSSSTVKRALDRFGIARHARGRRRLALDARGNGESRFTAECRRHGQTTFLAFPDGKSRCSKCNSEAVARCRRKRKETLAVEAGGRCRRCGYDEFLAALQFHHRDRREKDFGIAEAGITRSLERCRAEARKCVLLCANCHAAVEAGLIELRVELWEEPDPG